MLHLKDVGEKLLEKAVHFPVILYTGSVKLWKMAFFPVNLK